MKKENLTTIYVDDKVWCIDIFPTDEEEDTHNEGYEDGYGEGFVRCLEMQIDDLQAILKNY